MFHYLYKIDNNFNNMFYIGIHSTNNLDDGYMGSGKILKYVQNKHGIENFNKEILYRFKNRSAAQICEEIMVDQKFIDRNDTYNLTLGGGYGWFYSKGKIVVKDKSGNIMQVSVDDSRYLSGELVHVSKGRCVVKDKSGNTMSVSVNDPRYLSGELVGISKNKLRVTNGDKSIYCDSSNIPIGFSAWSKGTVNIKDQSGNIYRVSIDDPRYLSGELVHVSTGLKHPGINKGKAVVKDKSGNQFQVSVDDPRYLSGELVHINKGRTFKHKLPAKTRTCSHCGKTGTGAAMGRWHFNNCHQRIQ